MSTEQQPNTKTPCSSLVLSPYPGCYGRGGLLEEVPQEALVGRALAVAELVDVGRLERLRLLPHLLVHVLLPLVVLLEEEESMGLALGRGGSEALHS